MKTHFLLFFAFVMIACTPAPKKESIRIMWVNSLKTPCEKRSEQFCLQIQFGEAFDRKGWEVFSGAIEGFEFESGYLHQIEVRPIAETKGKTYEFVKLISKKMDTRLAINDLWVLTELADKKLSGQQNAKGERPLPRLEIHLAEMRFLGNDGCNKISGSLNKLQDRTIAFGRIMSTRMACPDNEIPLGFQKALEMATTYKISKLQLFLYGEARMPLAVFKKVD